MRNFLTHLYDCSPCVGCKTLRTIWALVVCNDVFNLKGLLEYSPLKRFLLNGDFHFDTPRMRLRPDEAGVYDPNLGKTS